MKLPPHDANGFYLPDGSPDPRGYYAPPSPPQEDQVETALAYLALLKPTKVAALGSYGLKHRAEEWGRDNGHCSYVTNGALIEAAIRLGLRVVPTGITARIGVSRRSVEQLQPG